MNFGYNDSFKPNAHEEQWRMDGWKSVLQNYAEDLPNQQIDHSAVDEVNRYKEGFLPVCLHNSAHFSSFDISLVAGFEH